MKDEIKTSFVEGKLSPFHNAFLLEKGTDQEDKQLYHLSSNLRPEDVKKFFNQQVRAKVVSDKFSGIPYRIVEVTNLPKKEHPGESSGFARVMMRLKGKR